MSNEAGLPASSLPDNYPIEVEFGDLLVEDELRPESDIALRATRVLELLWDGRLDGVVEELVASLGARSLRDYFRKPGKKGFWDDHVSAYSKSRRKAPIYWLLQSPKKNYSIWIYKPRMSSDTLFRALSNYLDPRIRLATDGLASLRNQKDAPDLNTKQVRSIERKIEKDEELVLELETFRSAIKEVADANWVLDHDDGVVLNVAPFHNLIPWTDAKKYWKQLLEGKYEWSSISKQLREKGFVKD